MSRYFLACAGATFALASFNAVAQAPPQRQESVHFVTFENDLYFHTDRYYTNGLQFSAKQASDRRGSHARAWTGWICSWLDCGDARLLASQSNVGQLLYTPSDISVRAPQPWDRPWAGLLYHEQSWSLLAPDQRRLTTLSTEIGVTGRASLAEQAQKLVHRILDREAPQGWDNQIGGSLVLMASAEQRTARDALSTRLWGEVQLNTASYWRIGVGNLQTYAAGGLAVVIGKDLPLVSPPPPGIGNKLTGSARALPIATSCFKVWIQCTAFGAAEARLMAYSVLLDGRLWGDDPEVDRRVFVTDITMGMRFDFPGTRSSWHGPWFAQFKVTRRSPEFRSSLIAVPYHKVGALTIGTEF